MTAPVTDALYGDKLKLELQLSNSIGMQMDLPRGLVRA
jgi:hypothetical protein